uniref:Four-carbon acid sugar kinase family protein n=1 Tax=Ignisphaera aggregans TaxID=334771 RepID=A0A7C4JM36_9CREN
MGGLVKVYKSVLVVADDFTGANDTILQFAKQGLRSISTLNLDSLKKYLNEYKAVAVSTESRADEPSTAYRKLYEVGLKVKEYKDLLLYKKVDSTLRGNIREEVKGLYDAVKPDLVVFAPAYPKQGRVTVNGVHLVNETPVDKTIFAKDPRAPVKSSNLRWYFEKVFGDLYTHVYLNELRSGKFLEKLGVYTLLSFDVENDFDLIAIARSLVNYSGKILWVGSAGLAEVLAYSAIIGNTRGRPTLLIVGSLNDVTKNQLNNYLKVFRCRLIKISIKDMVKYFDKEYNRVVEQAAEALRLGEDIAIATSYDQSQIDEGYALSSELGVEMDRVSDLIAKEFGRIMAKLILELGSKSFSGVFVAGGDTAIALVKSLGIDSLEVIGEVEPGIPILKCGDLIMVTKAGGFGEELTIVKIVTRIKGASI